MILICAFFLGFFCLSVINSECNHVPSKTLSCWNIPDYRFRNFSRVYKYHILSFVNVTFSNPEHFCDFLPLSSRYVIFKNSNPIDILCRKVLGCHRKRKNVKIIRGCGNYTNRRIQQWNQWSECSHPCDGGNQRRDRKTKQQYRMCNQDPCSKLFHI